MKCHDPKLYHTKTISKGKQAYYNENIDENQE